VVVIVALARYGTWWQTALAIAALFLYLLAVRLTRCRVETTQRRPCLWRVRGLLGTCDYHVGYKRSLPVLARGNGFLGLPMFMWPRDDFDGTIAREPQPSGSGHGARAVAGRAKRPGYDWVMMWLTGAGAIVALASFLRDLIAG
jgi:hypothetical protein